MRVYNKIKETKINGKYQRINLFDENIKTTKSTPLTQFNCKKLN